MPTIQNIAEHDFHFPILPDMTRKAGESEIAHEARVKSMIERRADETDEAFEKRMGDNSLLIPKATKEKGDIGQPGYQAGGPGEIVVTDEQLALLKGHRIAKRWFGPEVKKGQGLFVKEAPEVPRAKGKAA